MPIEFSLLSMSALRSAPGDVLENVARNGAAYIIEKNGERKACLVPLSVFLPDVAPERLADELEELGRSGYTARARISAEKELTLLVRIDSLELEILMPHGYPSRAPRVFLKEARAGTPHRWADGSLCLYGAITAWNPGRDTIRGALTLTTRWLASYRAWEQTGKWPGGDGNG